ncbi:MAG: SsrA-binding protein SmpB [Candidatus Omnitrophica bacterium]|nr:SsrA-binding protein SmpB [Candidatus Omnitrophota bacterium]
MEKSPRIENKKAYHDYEIIEKTEAGISLHGPEVKSIRQGSANLRDSFVRIEKREAFIYNFYIAPYQSSFEKTDPRRKKKLLLHKEQLRRLERKTDEKGLTIVPLLMYFNKNGIIKAEIALVKGKKMYDKRQVIKEREEKRQIEKKMKNMGAK